MSKILGVEWRSGSQCIGVVAVERVDGWKAYIGVGDGFNESADVSRIQNHGASLMEREARAFFPQLADRSYAP